MRPAQPPVGSGSKTGLQLISDLLGREVSPEHQKALNPFLALNHEWWRQFRAAYIEYGPGAADETGLAGQWGDLHRKVKKLKAPLWEGDETRLTRETPRQVLMDLIGHCFLAIEMMDRGLTPGRSSSPSEPASASSPELPPSVLDSLPTSLVCSSEGCFAFGCGISSEHLHRPSALWPHERDCP